MKSKETPENQNLFEDSFSKLSETEQKILVAAQQEFGEQGLQGARMQRIADNAGVNKALLHYYFRSKEALYALTIKSVATQVWGSFQEQMQKEAPQHDVRTIIKTFVAILINTLKDHQYLPRIMIRELSEGGSIALPIMQNIIKNIVAVPDGFAGLLMAGMAAGRVKQIPLPHILMNIFGMCVATFILKPAMLAIAPGLGFKIEYNEAFYADRIDSISETICDGILTKEN